MVSKKYVRSMSNDQEGSLMFTGGSSFYTIFLALPVPVVQAQIFHQKLLLQSAAKRFNCVHRAKMLWSIADNFSEQF